MGTEIISPLTGKPNVALVDKIKSKDIIGLYKRQIGIDVSRFFLNTEDVCICDCLATGYRFFYPAAIEGDEKFYEEMQIIGENGGRVYYRTNEFDHQTAYTFIANNTKVLDIGSGNGTFMKSVLSKTTEIAGLELNKYTADKCRKEGLEVYNELIETHSVRRPEYYDTVCTFQVLEHVYDVKNFIEGAIKTLKPGGQLIISVPNNEPYHMRYNKYETLNMPPHHVGLWNEVAFKSLEKQYPIILKNVIYNRPHNVKADAYHRVKKWIASKSLLNEHTLLEKIKIGFLLPFSLPFTLFDKARGKIRGGQICVLFEKKA